MTIATANVLTDDLKTDTWSVLVPPHKRLPSVMQTIIPTMPQRKANIKTVNTVA